MSDVLRQRDVDLDRAQDAWSAVLAFADVLTPAERTDRRDANGWSVKDHVMHLGAWKRSFIAWLDGRSGHVALGVSPELFAADDLDAINAASRDVYADLPWDDVRAHATVAHDDWIATIAALDEAALQRPLGRHTVGESLPDLTWEHDTEHLGWMEALTGHPVTATCSPAKAQRDVILAESATLVDEMHAFLAGLPEERRLGCRNVDGWCLKDHLAHLAAWNRWFLGELDQGSGAPAFGLTEEALREMWPQGFDVINAHIRGQYIAESWEETVDSFDTSWQALSARLRRLSTLDLTSRYRRDPLIEFIPAVTNHHYHEHLTWMREMAGET